jgi:hypothetical protein
MPPRRPPNDALHFDGVLLKPATAAELMTCVMRLVTTLVDD